MPDPIHPIDASAVSPPLPDAPGFEHFMVDTPGLQTHVATIGDGDPVVMLHGFPPALVAMAHHWARNCCGRLSRPLPRSAWRRLECR